MYTDARFRLSDPRLRDACPVCGTGYRRDRRCSSSDGTDILVGDCDIIPHKFSDVPELDRNGSPDISGESLGPTATRRASLPAERDRRERGHDAHKPDRDLERCYCSEYFHNTNDGISDSRRDRSPAAECTSPSPRDAEETSPDRAAAAAGPRRRRRHRHSRRHKKRRDSASEVEERENVEDVDREVETDDSNSDGEPAGYSFDLRVFGSYGSSEDIAPKRTERSRLRRKRTRPAPPPPDPSPDPVARDLELAQPPHLAPLPPLDTDSAVAMLMLTIDVSQIPLPPLPPAGERSPSTDSGCYNPEEFTPESSFDTDSPVEDCPSPVNSDCASPRCEAAPLDPERTPSCFATDASEDNFENDALENSASEESPNDDEIILQDSPISDILKDSHDSLNVLTLIDPVDKISPISDEIPKDSSKMEENLTPQDILKSSTDTFEKVPVDELVDTSPKNLEVISKDWLKDAPTRNEVPDSRLSPENSPFRGFNPLPALPYHLNSNLSKSVQHLAKSRRLSHRWLPVVALDRFDQISKKYVEYEHRYFVKNKKGTYKLRKRFRV